MTDNSYFNTLCNLILHHSIINISGTSGTGKTTLTMQLIGEFLKKRKDSYCLWVQASEIFPKKRFQTLFPINSNALLRNVLLTPSNKTIISYREQEKTIKNIFSPKTLLPPNLRFIVIDNISHHLRFATSEEENIKTKVHLQNQFFDALIYPLIMFCQLEQITLILVHEMTFVPKLNATNKYFYALFDRMEALDITLTSNFYSKKSITLRSGAKSQTYSYSIGNSGVNVDRPLFPNSLPI